MHMADALISPTVGAAMWAATAGLVSYSAKKVQKELDDSKVPLMGVLGAFVFSAQMINFSIPATGSSGHIGGAMLLAILLGPHAAFLTIASILTIQALFFADGGLLALGCNIFNMGFFPCFIAYPLIYKKLAGENVTKKSLIIGVIISAIIALQLGAFGVVFETFMSGITELPFNTFVLLMQPIHLAIGFVEGLVTTAVVLFILKERPEIIQRVSAGKRFGNITMKPILVSLMLMALLTGGIISWFASSDPDGLEWSIAKTAGEEELQQPEGIHSVLADLQKKIAILPDYNFRDPEPASKGEVKEKGSLWPSVDSGLSLAGIVGSVFTLIMAGSIGKILQVVNRRQQKCHN